MKFTNEMKENSDENQTFYYDITNVSLIKRHAKEIWNSRIQLTNYVFPHNSDIPRHNKDKDFGQSYLYVFYHSLSLDSLGFKLYR